ncbi:hypothetical protein N473_13150 [Pseudoalteromonas luteoviolacea CPMOR-1]|uniref:Ricin B lectin domain-containing protein n=1 Tax=Pseudoalteromonas luteoviolacea CPMOR-1 TaxID=1365248 RepID=A0A161Z836_9GAMM|nr:hypothetical protein [Pseudoalteromonas luteoviolacea]KZN64733.1 hypothetical protein N473_13150 [Pseudoalteromonas luteoviolacea CPMOR-1]
MIKQHLKLITQGQDFGYITISKETSGLFYGNSPIEHATEFELIPCRKDCSAFYYKIANSQKSYMDLSFASNVVKITQANNPESEKVCAWKIHKDNLYALSHDQSPYNILSRSAFKLNSRILYAAPSSSRDFSQLEVALCKVPYHSYIQ